MALVLNDNRVALVPTLYVWIASYETFPYFTLAVTLASLPLIVISGLYIFLMPEAVQSSGFHSDIFSLDKKILPPDAI